MIRFFWILLFFFGLGNTTYAQSPWLLSFNIEHGLPSSQTYHSLVDLDNHLWVATDNGLAMYDGTGLFKVYDTRHGIPENVVFHLSVDHQNRLWFFTKHDFVGYVKDGEVVMQEDLSAQLRKMARSVEFDIHSAYFNEEGTLLLGLNGAGSIVASSPPYNKIDLLTSGSFAYSEHDSNEFLFALDFGGNKQLKSSAKTWNSEFSKLRTLDLDSVKNYRTSFSRACYFNEAFVFSVDNRLYVKDKKGKVTLKRVFDHYILALYADKSGRVWVGLNNSDALVVDLLTAEKIEAHEAFSVTSFHEDKHGGVWMTTLNNGLFYCPNLEITIQDDDFGNVRMPGKPQMVVVTNPSTYVLNSLTEEKIYLGHVKTGNRVYTKGAFIRNGQVFIYGNNTLYRLNPDYSITELLKIKEIIQAIEKDYKGNYYLLSEQGVFDLTFLPNQVDANLKIRLTRPSDLFLLNDSLAFVSSYSERLWKVNLRTSKIVKHYKSRGIPRRVESVCAGGDDILWLGSKSGVSFVDLKSNETFESPLLNSLIKNSVKKIRVFGDFYRIFSGGKMYSVPRNSLAEYHSKTKYQFELVQEVGGRLWIRAKSSELAFVQSETLQLTIAGTNINSISSSNNEFSVQGLRAGSYTCIVTRKLPNGKEQFYEVPILVKGPEVSWWRLALILVLIFVVTTLIYRYQKKRLVRKMKREALQEIEKIELRMVAMRSQMNPHFLFNALNSIQGFVMASEKMKAIEYIGKFASLMRQVLESSKSEQITIESELEILENYMKIEQIRFENKFQYDIKIDESVYVNSKIPAMMLQPIVENAIVHGLRNKEEKGGKLILEMRKEDNNILCKITDNGVGREKAQSLKTSSHNSFGSQNLSERLNLYREMGFEGISVEYKDITGREGNSLGTEVICVLPIVG